MYPIAAAELARYFFLSRAALSLAGDALAPQDLRILLSPNLLLVAAFFFMALDPEKYSVFKPLALMARLLTLFGLAVGIPSMVSRLGQVQGGAPAVLLAFGGIAAWDALSAAALLFLYPTVRRQGMDSVSPGVDPGSVIETVEVE